MATLITFYDGYVERHDRYRVVADLIGDRIRSLLELQGFFLHGVDVRAKKPDSLLAKLRDKGYSDPSTQVTDLVGVRVITYFKDDVEGVVSSLRQHFEIDEANSASKAPNGPHEFGYKSEHLICIMDRSAVAPSLPDDFIGCKFEVQCRSILEHCWAEIEHEIKYKSATEYPAEVQRSFAAAAASLELIEDVFRKLRSSFQDAVSSWRKRLDGSDVSVWSSTLDAAGVVAVIESLLNREHRTDDSLERSGYVRAIAAAVREAGLTTPTALKLAFGVSEVQERLQAYAANAGSLVVELPVGVVVAVVVRSMPHFPDWLYPELVDSKIERVFDSGGEADSD